MQLLTKEHKFEANGKEVSVYTREYTNPKNKYLLGFANVIIKEGDKLHSSYSSISVVEAKDGTVFLKEPQQKAYKNKDGEITSNPYYIMAKSIKEDLSKRILENLVQK